MNVGLADMNSLIQNAALMKVSAWHKAQGDTVAWFMPLAGADIVYASRPFPKKAKLDGYLPADAILGGTGYDPATRLPMGDLDDWMPDYGLYSNCTQSIGRLTRGCPRSCPWCVVGPMDGTRVRQVADLADFDGGFRVMRLLDDNLLALPDVAIAACEWALAHKRRLHFDALDIRLLRDKDLARLLYRASDGDLRFSFDEPAHESAVREGVALLKSAGASLTHLRFYVLTNFDTTEAEDDYRLDVIRGLGVRPFVQCFEDDSHPIPQRKRDRRRWANLPQVFTTCSFTDFRARAGDAATR